MPKLLLVDDEPLLRRALIRKLQRCVSGWHVTEANDPVEARKILEEMEHHDKVRLAGDSHIDIVPEKSPMFHGVVVLTDWSMPHGGGAWVLRLVHDLRVKHNVHIPALVWSANFLGEVAGADGFVSKNGATAMDEVIAGINLLWEKHHGSK